MKKNIIYNLIIVTLLAVGITSCQNEQDDLFDKAAPQRMKELLDKTRQILTSSPNGWALDYYPDKNISYGGYVFAIKFTDSHATVGSEIKPGEFCTSLYRFTDDNGPVLTFDSYNEIMHHFATPDSENPHAHDGDFEFIILDVTDNVIKLRGKRTGNDMYMYRLDRDPKSYLEDVYNMALNIYLPKLKGTIGNNPFDAIISADNRLITFKYENNNISQYFVPTDKGIRFRNPININGTEFSTLNYTHKNLTYTSPSDSESALTMTHIIEDNYVLYDDIVGKYTIFYNHGDSSFDMELKPVADKTSFIMTGINPKYDVIVKYDRSRGCPVFLSQQVGTDYVGNELVLIWFACKEYDGLYSINTGCGMYAIPDIDNPGTYTFEPNEYKTVHANSFYIAQIKSRDYKDDLDGDARESWQVNGTNDIDNLTYMTKKN